MRDEVEVVYARGGLSVAIFGAISINAVRGPITSEFLRESNDASLRLTRARGEKIVSLTLVRTDVPIPDAALRDESSRLAKAANAYLSGLAHVVYGQGFAASAVRSVLTAMTLLSGGPPRRTFSEVGPAIDWLAARLAVAPPDLAPVTEWSERTLREDDAR